MDVTLQATSDFDSTLSFSFGGWFGAPLAAFDLGVIDAGDGDSATVTFGYPDADVPALPALTFFSPVTKNFGPAAGSTLVDPSLSIDPVARLAPWCSTRGARRRC